VIRIVIAGLDPALHLFFWAKKWITGSRRWRAGPVMTPRMAG
jgi:hypothetical protein